MLLTTIHFVSNSVRLDVNRKQNAQHTAVRSLASKKLSRPFFISFPPQSGLKSAKSSKKYANLKQTGVMEWTDTRNQETGGLIISD